MSVADWLQIGVSFLAGLAGAGIGVAFLAWFLWGHR